MNTLPIIFALATEFHNLPPKLLDAVCYVESTHRVHVINHNDGKSASLGVCQIKLQAARHMGFRGDAKELMKPNRNIYYAAKFLNYQLKRYKGNIDKALVAYNQGKARRPASPYSKKVRTVWETLK